LNRPTISLIRYAGTHMKNSRYGKGMCGILRRAVDRGWRTTVVFSRPPRDESWLAPFQELGVCVEYLPRPRANFDLGCMWRAYRLCRRHACTVFHCDNMHTSPMIGAALAGVPVRVWSKRSMQPVFEAGGVPSLRDRLALSVRSTCALATRVLPVSSAVGDELHALGLARQKITVFRNACDAPELAIIDRRQARGKLGLRPDDLAFCTVGRAAAVKGWDVLLSAFLRIAADAPNAKLVLVGDHEGPEGQPVYEALRRKIDAAGLAERVIFTGFVEDVFPILAAADVFVLPSRSEGDSNALLQALISGLPCIATRVGSAPDLIQHESNGLLVPRDDADALLAAMSRMMADADLRARFAATAAAQKHAPTSREYADRLVDLYESLLPTHFATDAMKSEI
jgi:glycosyltransferase involved in cell wall biosynthesis